MIFLQLAGILLAAEVKDHVIHLFAEVGIVGQHLVTEACGGVMDNLERIKENQFTLYNEIVEANGNTSSLLSDIGDDIAFSAYQNKAMKDSLETMKYLETAQYLRHR